MDPRLDALIAAFTGAQRYVMDVLVGGLGLAAPESAGAWRALGAATCDQAGRGGMDIRPHGIGLCFHDAVTWIDFDFGPHGESDGFDAWRLWRFATENRLPYGFTTLDEIRSAVTAAELTGEIVRQGQGFHRR